MYHPRISVQNDFIYRQLNWQEQEAFNRLYNHYYYQRHNKFWYDEAMKKLPVLTQSTSMLVCGEDLGMVPECVPWVMNQLQILSLEIQRMPKDPKDEFGHVYNYPCMYHRYARYVEPSRILERRPADNRKILSLRIRSLGRCTSGCARMAVPGNYQPTSGKSVTPLHPDMAGLDIYR